MALDLFTLQGRVALVTGGSRGIGKMIAAGFLAQGAKVYISSRKADACDAAAEELSQGGGTCISLPQDVSSVAGCQALAKAIEEREGQLDILVNNVGIGGGDGPAHLVEEDAFDRILAVNLKSAWLTSKAALPGMRAQGGGAIINISSLASIAGGTQVAYEVSKAAMNRLTTSIAQSNAKYRVRCNAILPGLMDTPMAVAGIAQATGQDQEAVRAARGARVPLGAQMGTAWDTAYAALFLASDESAFITGVLLPVDGGMSSRIG